MKKLILILTLIFALVLCFVACEDLVDNSNEGQTINALSGGAPETEEPTTEAPTTEKPASEEPTSEEPTTEEPTSEEPTTEEPTSEEPTSEEPTTYNRVVDEYNRELNDVFSQIQDRVIDKSKFVFYVSEQEQYYEIKNSGEYDDDVWIASRFTINIKYDISLVHNTEWYKDAESQDLKNLNASFCDMYSCFFENSSYLSGAAYYYGLMVSYTSNEGLLDDLTNILEMMELGYISEVSIGYSYGLPNSYMTG